MTSILTNNGAMVALQTLNSINMNLENTQNAISTGKDVATAKDNSAIWAISKVMESDVAGFNAVSDSLALGESTVAVATAGAEQITDLLREMKEKVTTATGENVDNNKIKAEVDELTKQITSIIKGSQFNGANLLNKNGGDLTVLSSLDRNGTGTSSTVSASNITVSSVNFEDNLTLSGIDVSDSSQAELSIAKIEALIQTAVDGAAALGASAARIEKQSEFVSKVSDAMKSGIGALVDTDMEAASARLKALQTQQQLGVQALSIANSAPQTLQQLFR
ncbi:flagellin [Phaeobacter gallaeciensis]|uniref:Flagellin n=1 Tax=Phaeobacter gallaeciensis TaxID=60890 RepID=A0A1B0ZT77_9RHOB|nr:MULTISPECIES: flagellin [Phaeobacter]ANP37309.1 flagellin [Phaeobacter gallaeciensis]MDE4059520.1 flagellin [Phaeobacter gallaeciensis]MDE4122843.1 flagellin [Phaeobacter gallaeciensis]MDE4127006.1 flagellin [Phaeobacter gallaeciensis]MDE4145056.1 flagellin [Phaeobacter gallaeciensis]